MSFSIISLCSHDAIERSAGMQTMKGIFSVGLQKSTTYLLAKMKKRFFPI